MEWASGSVGKVRYGREKNRAPEGYRSGWTKEKRRDRGVFHSFTGLGAAVR
jgi:hypothetical protein